MRHIQTIPVLAVMALASACTDEISFDYSTVEPLPVIEGYVEEGSVSVRVTMSRDVTDSSRNHFVEDAEVRLSGPGGALYTVPYEGDGLYRCGGVECVEGGVYSLSVSFGGQTYEATDTMAMRPEDPRGGFFWEDIMETDVVSYRFAAMTPADSLTSYVVSLTRGGKAYRWSACNNYGSYDGLMDGRLLCFNRDDMDGKKDSHPEDVIRDGEVMEFLIAGVSRCVGDYYDALDLSGETCANPEWSFSGKALGIFAARNVVRLPATVFSLESVGDEADIADAIK